MKQGNDEGILVKIKMKILKIDSSKIIRMRDDRMIIGDHTFNLRNNRLVSNEQDGIEILSKIIYKKDLTNIIVNCRLENVVNKNDNK